MGKPRPPRVANVSEYLSHPPPALSARCRSWCLRFEEGWRENRRIGEMGYHCSAEYYGVYIWEYLHVLRPWLKALEERGAVAMAGRVLGLD